MDISSLTHSAGICDCTAELLVQSHQNTPSGGMHVSNRTLFFNWGVIIKIFIKIHCCSPCSSFTLFNAVVMDSSGNSRNRTTTPSQKMDCLTFLLASPFVPWRWQPVTYHGMTGRKVGRRKAQLTASCKSVMLNQHQCHVPSPGGRDVEVESWQYVLRCPCGSPSLLCQCFISGY